METPLPLELQKQILSLIQISNALGPDGGFGHKETMGKVLGEAEHFFEKSPDARLAYWLGIAFRNFTAWHARGDDRKPYLEKAVFYFGTALELGQADDSVPVRLDRSSRIRGNVDQLMIHGELGMILVDAPLVRDLDKGIEVLSFVYNNESDYQPSLCWYADAFFKKGEFEKAAEVGLALHDRAKNSEKWKAHVPTAPMATVASAYRALAKDAKKRGDIQKARSCFRELVQLGLASESDWKALDSLNALT